MQSNLVSYLQCPITNSDLQLHIHDYFTTANLPSTEIKSGYLLAAGGYIYPIINGVPRLLPNSFLLFAKELEQQIPDFEIKKNALYTAHASIIDTYTEMNRVTQRSFSAEWDMFDYTGDKTWDADTQGMRERFLKEIDEYPEQNSSSAKIVLDAGCGNGLLDKIMSNYFKEIVAVDFSESVVNAYKNCYQPNIHFVQADIQRLPFKSNSFDTIQCSGVLVCIKDQYAGFKHLTSFLKSKGKLSIWLYHPRKNWVHNLFNWMRERTSKMSWSVQHIIYHYILLPISFIIKRIKGNTQNKREMLIDIYDWFSPQYRWENTHEEAAAWFAQDFESNKVTTNELFGFNITGVKK